jgi:hypothetical protein
MTEHDTYSYTAIGNVKPLPEDASPTDIMDTEEGVENIRTPTDGGERDNKKRRRHAHTQEEHITQYYTQI